MYLEKKYVRTAKKISFAPAKRPLSTIKAVVFHYTGNKRDTAKGNCDYFATSNKRTAGAHFFISKDGSIAQSIPIEYAAYAVGGIYSLENGAGSQYQKLTNANTISIELCDAINGVSWQQMQASRELYLWILKRCKNVNKIVRHWDVNGKTCPLCMIGINKKKQKRWRHFRSYVKNGYQFSGIVTKTAAVRTSPKVTSKNKMGSIPKRTEVRIGRVRGSWGQMVNSGPLKGKWISLKKVKYF